MVSFCNTSDSELLQNREELYLFISWWSRGEAFSSGEKKSLQGIS